MGKTAGGWGYVVLAPDSFGPRGVKSVCTTPTAVTANMRVADIAGALDYLATRPDVVKGNIGIIGHSHGGLDHDPFGAEDVRLAPSAGSPPVSPIIPAATRRSIPTSTSRC